MRFTGLRSTFGVQPLMVAELQSANTLMRHDEATLSTNVFKANDGKTMMNVQTIDVN